MTTIQSLPRPRRVHTTAVTTAPQHDYSDPGHALFEESLLTLLRQRYPAYRRMDGHPVRQAMTRAFVRFVLERTRGNQSRAAEVAGYNRNTLRRLIRSLAIDWKSLLNT